MEKNKKYRLKKDDYIKELEIKNKELTLIVHLLSAKLETVRIILNKPIRINSDIVNGSVETNSVFKDLNDKTVQDKFKDKGETIEKFLLLKKEIVGSICFICNKVIEEEDWIKTNYSYDAVRMKYIHSGKCINNR